MESEIEGIQKSSIFGTAVSCKKKKKKDSGIGTTLTGTGTNQAKPSSTLLVPVQHLLVPVPPCVNGPF